MATFALIQINRMSRWQVVDRVRELSTKAVKSGGDGSTCSRSVRPVLMSVMVLLVLLTVDIKSLKFARGTRFSQMEAQEKYRDECQRIFDLQNE